MANVFKERDAKTGEFYPKYRGWLRLGPGRGERRKVTLFECKRTSEERLRRLQAEADAALENLEAARRREFADLPISQHVDDYLASLKRTSKSDEHHRISGWTLRRLVELAGWKFLRDISQSSVERVVIGLTLKSGKPATVEYQNAFIKRAKAFSRWCVPERLAVNPLEKLKRGSTVRAERRRARRAGSDLEIAGLVDQCDDRRALAVCLAALAGLRREECSSLTWGDVKLNATVPFIACRSEWTKNADAPWIPLHPALVELLKRVGPGMPAVRVVATVPDVETIERYLRRAGFEMVQRGRRLDFHALRHTFVTNLSRVGCTRATRMALCRHVKANVTDGYEHTTLQAMHEAICRLPSPLVKPTAVALKTGTNDAPVGVQKPVSIPVSTECISMPFCASSCTVGVSREGAYDVPAMIANGEISSQIRGFSGTSPECLAPSASVSLTGPSTQVD